MNPSTFESSDAALMRHRARDKSKDDWDIWDREDIIRFSKELIERSYSEGYAAEKKKLMDDPTGTGKYIHMQTCYRYCHAAAEAAMGVASHDWDLVQSAIGSLVTVSGATDWHWALRMRDRLWGARPKNISPR